jgi:hypothetical protein
MLNLFSRGTPYLALIRFKPGWIHCVMITPTVSWCHIGILCSDVCFAWKEILDLLKFLSLGCVDYLRLFMLLHFSPQVSSEVLDLIMVYKTLSVYCSMNWIIYLA